MTKSGITYYNVERFLQQLPTLNLTQGSKQVPTESWNFWNSRPMITM